MADNVDPTINMLLTQYPEFFNLADSSPGQASSSSSKASTAQPETSKLDRSESKRPNFVISVEDSLHFSNTRKVSVGNSEWEFTSNHKPDTGAGTRSKSEEKEAEPSLSKIMKLAEKNKIIPDAGLSEMMKLAEERKFFPEASLSEMMELAEKYEIFPDAGTMESLSDLLLELPAPSKKSSGKRSTSPPLKHALAQRACILSHQKPGASHLRNEIHESPADDDRQASNYDVVQSKQRLEEKARLETVRKREVDMLMERRKQKAEADRAREEQLKREADMRMKKRKKKAETDRAREEHFKELDHKYETLHSQMRAGFLSAGQFLADLREVVNKMKALRKDLEEEFRLELVGGRVMDMLVERQKKMAQADGVANRLLP